MAEIERTRAAHLERITVARDVVEVQLGAAEDEALHRRGLERGERDDVLLHPGEERGVADAGDLHRLDVAGALVARRERLQQLEVVDHRERRREGADEVLLPEGVDAVLHAHARIVLRQGRGGEPDQPDATVRGRRGEAHHVEQRAAADGEHVVVPVDVEPLDERVDLGDAEVGVLHRLAADDEHRRADEQGGVGAGREPRLDPRDQSGRRLRKRLVDDDQHLGPASERHRPPVDEHVGEQRVFQREHVVREMHLVPPTDFDGAFQGGHRTDLFGRTGQGRDYLIRFQEPHRKPGRRIKRHARPGPGVLGNAEPRDQSNRWMRMLRKPAAPWSPWSRIGPGLSLSSSRWPPVPRATCTLSWTFTPLRM